MNFTYDEANLSKTIKKLQNNGDSYSIEYLDGSSSCYFCSNSNELQKIKDIMIEQAKERQENMDVKNFDFIKSTYLSGSVISSLAVSLAQNKNKNILSGFFLAFLLFNIYKYRDSSKKIKELKKYKLFLELLPNLNEVNTSEILKCIEFDNIYQVPIDITNLDEYSYNKVKKIYRTYKLSKSKSKNI